MVMAALVTVERREDAQGTYLLLLLSRALLANFCHVRACTPLHRDSEYALNLAVAGRHKGVSLGLAMKFVDRAPFLSIQYC